MGRYLMSLLFALYMLTACSQTTSVSTSTVCNENWYQKVEQSLSIADEQGHGPDIGLTEWRSAVEFKLGVRGQTDLPPLESDAWCAYIDTLLQ